MYLLYQGDLHNLIRQDALLPLPERCHQGIKFQRHRSVGASTLDIHLFTYFFCVDWGKVLSVSFSIEGVDCTHAFATSKHIIVMVVQPNCQISLLKGFDFIMVTFGCFVNKRCREFHNDVSMWRIRLLLHPHV